MFIANNKIKDQQKKIKIMRDRPVKSVVKTITWRMLGTLDTILISYVLTGKITVALSIGSVEVITKMILYYFHERIWAHLRWGRIMVILQRNTRRSRLSLQRIIHNRA